MPLGIEGIWKLYSTSLSGLSSNSDTPSWLLICPFQHVGSSVAWFTLEELTSDMMLAAVCLDELLETLFLFWAEYIVWCLVNPIQLFGLLSSSYLILKPAAGQDKTLALPLLFLSLPLGSCSTYSPVGSYPSLGSNFYLFDNIGQTKPQKTAVLYDCCQTTHIPYFNRQYNLYVTTHTNDYTYLRCVIGLSSL